MRPISGSYLPTAVGRRDETKVCRRPGVSDTVSAVHNVAAFLAREAASRPEAPAVVLPHPRDGSARAEWSFATLEAEASAAARAFVGQGIGRGQRVLLMVRPGLDLIRSVFALFKIGAVPVVIDPGMGLRKFLGCVRRSEPEALVGVAGALRAARVFRSSFASVGPRVRADAAGGAAPGADPFPAVEPDAGELAAVLFTSGSTGPPKGVCYAHGMFAAQVEAIRAAYGMTPGEVDLPMLPVFALFNPALGMCTVVPPMNPGRPAKVRPERIVRVIRAQGVTNSFGSPTIWRRIAEHCIRSGIALPGVRRVLLAGAPVPPDLLRSLRQILPGAALHTPYGATEALPVSSVEAETVLGETGARTLAGDGTCVGRPLPGVRVRIAEVADGPRPVWDNFAELPQGGVGEIVVAGPTVTRHYDGLPEADAAAKVAEGDVIWHRMGDLGWMDAGERLWFCGRKAERVVTPEGTLHTECCEPVFNQHPKVYRSALIDAGGGTPAIVVEPVRGAFPLGRRRRAAFAEELLRLGASVAGTAAIRRVFFARSFPVDVRHNAKIHRLALARRFGDR